MGRPPPPAAGAAKENGDGLYAPPPHGTPLPGPSGALNGAVRGGAAGPPNQLAPRLRRINEAKMVKLAFSADHREGSRPSLDEPLLGAGSSRENLASEAWWLKQSPWVKWQIRRVIPWKLMLHLLLALLSAGQVIFLSTNQQMYSRGIYRTIRDQLQSSTPVATLDDLTDAIEASCQNYQGAMTQLINPINQVADPQLVLTTFADGGRVYDTGGEYSLATEVRAYSLNMTKDLQDSPCLEGTPLGPEAAGVANRTVARSIVSVDLLYGLQGISHLDRQKVCIQWNIAVTYSFHKRGGAVLPSFSANQVPCEGVVTPNSVHRWTWWTNCILAVLSAISLVLTVRSFCRQYGLFRRVRKQFRELESQTEGVTWKGLPKDQKYAFFNWWVPVTIACNIIMAIVCLSLMAKKERTGNKEEQIGYGLAVFLAWVNLIQYLEFSPEHYLLILTLKNAFPEILRFLMCALLAWVGYSLFGISAFGQQSVLFKDLGSGLVVLFAAVNGDDIYEFFNELEDASTTFVGRTYLYTFIVFFTWISLGVLISMVTRGYEKANAEVEALKQEDFDIEPHLDDTVWTSAEQSPEELVPGSPPAAVRHIRKPSATQPINVTGSPNTLLLHSPSPSIQRSTSIRKMNLNQKNLLSITQDLGSLKGDDGGGGGAGEPDSGSG